MTNLMPVLAIQKRGNLAEESREFLNRVGVATEKNDDKLDYIENDDNKVLLLRYGDILNAVKQGFADIGIVGSDSIIELDEDVLEYTNLPFGHCKIVLAVRKDASCISVIELDSKTVATEFFKISENYFKNLKVHPKIYYVRGSTELFCNLGYVDAIIDITKSGDFLKSNKLHIIDTIQEVNAILVYRKGCSSPLLNKIKESLK